MKTLYFDCKNGISGDMMLKALMELGSCTKDVTAAMKREDFTCDGSDKHTADHGPNHHHGRSYSKVRELIDNSHFSPKAKSYAAGIYGYIAQAEAEVHGESLETIHFHEVGRDEAIRNALGIGAALEAIAPDMILVSPIYDGKGFIDCSHGRIPVPVPAVRALMKKSSFDFKTADVDTEMVTPSGLASLMGIGARAACMEALPHELSENCSGEASKADAADENDSANSSYTISKQTEATGSRNTGRGGLKAYILEA